jgi:hypothetical protein
MNRHPRCTERLAAAVVTATLAFGPAGLTGAASAAAKSKVTDKSKACMLVSPALLKALTGKNLAVFAGADNDGSSVCTYNGAGIASVGLFENMPPSADVGIRSAIGPAAEVRGISGGSALLTKKKDAMMIRKGNKVIQLSLVGGGTVTSEATAKAFANAVIKKM